MDFLSDDYIDGNALAGPLLELFTVDMTGAVRRCVNCGTEGPVAGVRVYAHAPGLIARCPSCQEVLMRLVRGPSSAWLDLRGTMSLRIPMPSE